MIKISSLIILLVLDIKSQSLPTGCPVNEWQCTDGTCIQHSGRCDNFPDCNDGSDEQNCNVSPVCLEGLESCPQPNGTTICVEKAIGCSCGSVPEIAHGKIVTANTTIGSEANVTCDKGHDATSTSVTCQVTGTWETALCIPRDCGPVTKISFGKIDLLDDNNTLYGASGNVVCDSGYETSIPVITCQESGKWETAVCKIKDCGKVPAIDFGKLLLNDVNNTVFGALASVICDIGYETKKTHVKCQSSGLWETATCTAKDCGPVQKVSFGKLSLRDPSNTTFGASANVTCDTGYETNESTVLCQSSGVWDNVACKPKDCGSLPTIPFGNISLNTDKNSTFGATAFVTCDDNFAADTPIITCQSSGVWENPTCTNKGCRYVPVINNGMAAVIGNASAGSLARVTCDSGYVASIPLVMCQLSGIWETAVCTPTGCGSLPVIDFGNISLTTVNNSTFGATALVTCLDKYATTTPIIQCQSSGVWENATCLSIGCGSVPKIFHGRITLTGNFSIGSSAIVTCDIGYESNVSTVVCRNSLLWETASCTAKDCGSPPTIPFGNISLNTVKNSTLGATAFVTCDDNFATDTPIITCQSSGVWQKPVCSNKGCRSVPVINNGMAAVIGNASAGSLARVTCDSGYVASIPFVMCQLSGFWETAVCTSTGCGSLPKLTHGTISLSGKYSIGSSAIVTCDIGYESNVSTVVCRNSGLWETTSCKAKDCGTPPTIPFGNISLTADKDSTFGAIAFVTCDDNFSTNAPIIACQSSGKWENPACTNKGCRSLPVINNGRIVVTGNASAGSLARVTCDSGYVASIPLVMCQLSGFWETAICTPKDCGPPPPISNGNITLSYGNTSAYGAEAFVQCDVKYFASVSKITCQSSGVWESATCVSENKLNYDRCTSEHGVCTQYIYENIRLRPLKKSKCKIFCHCAYASTLPDGSVTYKWVEHNCPSGTLFDDKLPSPVCNHDYMVWC